MYRCNIEMHTKGTLIWTCCVPQVWICAELIKRSVYPSPQQDNSAVLIFYHPISPLPSFSHLYRKKRQTDFGLQKPKRLYMFVSNCL